MEKKPHHFQAPRTSLGGLQQSPLVVPAQRTPGPLLLSPLGSVQRRWHLPNSRGRPGDGEEGPMQYLATSSSLWSAGRPCAGRLCLPFPPAGWLDASLPVSRCQARGAAPLAGSRVAGGSTRTPDPPGTPLPLSHLGEPRHGMRRGLEPRHTRGGGGQCLCPRGSRRAQGSDPQERVPQPPDPPLSPAGGHLSGHRPPSSQNSHIWPHVDTTVAS